MGGKCFSDQVPLLWNHLPVLLHEAHRRSTLKTKYETFLSALTYQTPSWLWQMAAPTEPICTGGVRTDATSYILNAMFNELN